MSWIVDVSRKAAKWIKRHPSEKKRIDQAINDLKNNPYIGEPLAGKYKGNYKYRKGKIRIIYTIDHTTRTIRIEKIKYRKNAYKGD